MRSPFRPIAPHQQQQFRFSCPFGRSERFFSINCSFLFIGVFDSQLRNGALRSQLPTINFRGSFALSPSSERRSFELALNSQLSTLLRSTSFDLHIFLSTLSYQLSTSRLRRPQPDEMRSIFASLGLGGDFWDLQLDRIK